MITRSGDSWSFVLGLLFFDLDRKLRLLERKKVEVIELDLRLLQEVSGCCPLFGVAFSSLDPAFFSGLMLSKAL